MPDLGQYAIEVTYFLEPWYRQYGYLIVFIGGLLENSLFFGWILPGGLVSALGGFYSRNIDPILAMTGQEKNLSFIGIFIFSSLGAFLGKLSDYFIGFYFGKKIINFFGLQKQEQIAGHFIEKHGLKAFFLTAVIGQLRSILNITAGITRKPLKWFSGVSVLTSLIWGGLFTTLGYFIGQNRKTLENTISYLGIFGWLIIILWIISLLWSKYKPETILPRDSN